VFNERSTQLALVVAVLLIVAGVWWLRQSSSEPDACLKWQRDVQLQARTMALQGKGQREATFYDDAARILAEFRPPDCPLLGSS
jgi:hypothetical protein